jgi:hypothetical protein
VYIPGQQFQLSLHFLWLGVAVDGLLESCACLWVP